VVGDFSLRTVIDTAPTAVYNVNRIIIIIIIINNNKKFKKK